MQERPWPNTPWIMFGAVNNFIAKFLIEKYGIPDFVIDNSNDKIGKIVTLSGGVEVRRPDNSLLSFVNTHSIIIVTYHYWDELEAQLLDIGFPKEKVYIAFRDFAVFHTFENYALSCGVDVYHPEPKELHIELSRACNCQCIYCMGHGNFPLTNVSKGFMNWETLRKIVGQISKITSIQCVNFIGIGESFLNKDWYEMIQYILEHTNVKKINLYTNGILLNKNNIIKLAKLSAESIRVVLSTDGENPKENDLYRVGSKYEIIKKNLLNAYDMLESDKRFCYVISNARPIAPTELNTDGMVESAVLASPPEHLLKDFPFAEFACYRIASYGWNGAGYFVLKKVTYSDENYRLCLNPFYVLAFDYVGNLLRCPCMEAAFNGVMNIRQGDVLSVWKNDKILNQIRKNFINHYVDHCFCDGCPQRGMGSYEVFLNKTK